MGNEQSQLDGGGGGRRGELPWGFQVLRNTNEKLAIEPWFDFVVGINGRQIVSVVLGVWWGWCSVVGYGTRWVGMGCGEWGCGDVGMWGCGEVGKVEWRKWLGGQSRRKADSVK